MMRRHSGTPFPKESAWDFWTRPRQGQDLLDEHADKIDSGIDKAADAGRRQDRRQVRGQDRHVQEKAKDALDSHGDDKRPRDR